MFLTNTFSFTVTEFWGTLPQVNSQYQSGQPLCFGLSIRKGDLSLCLLPRKISGCLQNVCGACTKSLNVTHTTHPLGNEIQEMRSCKPSSFRGKTTC